MWGFTDWPESSEEWETISSWDELKDLMIDVGFDLVLLDRECLGKWEYDRGHYLTGGITSKRYIGRKI